MTDDNQEVKDQVEPNDNFSKAHSKKSFQTTKMSSKHMLVGSVLRTLGEVSKINYLPSDPLEIIMSSTNCTYSCSLSCSMRLTQLCGLIAFYTN